MPKKSSQADVQNRVITAADVCLNLEDNMTIMLCAHFFLPIYTKIAMFLQWESIALYTESKEDREKHLDETLKICFQK